MSQRPSYSKTPCWPTWPSTRRRILGPRDPKVHSVRTEKTVSRDQPGPVELAALRVPSDPRDPRAFKAQLETPALRALRVNRVLPELMVQLDPQAPRGPWALPATRG